jgi:subtilisin family serine protease
MIVLRGVVMLLLCFIGAFIYLFNAMPIITNHIRGGLGVRETHATENTLFFSLDRPVGQRATSTREAERAQFLIDLEAAVSRDKCDLSFSDTGSPLVLFTVHCAFLKNEPWSTRRAPLPALNETRHFLASRHYKVRQLEYLQRSRVHYWYGGSKENLDVILESYFHRPAAPEKAQKASVGARYVEMMAQWALSRIDIHYGLLDSLYIYNQLGSSTDIYVMDTGILTSHVEFSGGTRAQFLVNTVGDGIDTDCNGHGTMVASLAGGTQFGVAKNCTLWAVKVLGCSGLGDTFTIVAGAMAVVEQAASRPGRRAVASFSLGGDPSTSIDDAMLYLLANNISVVVAAGNEYGDACQFSPSRLGGNTDVICVGASDVYDNKPAFSNYGQCVSISAPGVNVTGAYATSDTATIVLSGTSMATPLVSGVVALVYDQVPPDYTPADVYALLNAWATPNVVQGATLNTGGRNLVYSLVVFGQEPDLPTAPTPTAPPDSPDLLRDDQNTGSQQHTLSLLLFMLALLFAL